MSYYVDPWLFNCADNPADSPADQRRAAHDHQGDAAGAQLRPRQGRDAGLGRGQRRHRLHQGDRRRSSPDFASVPGEAPYKRTIPPSCISMPTEGNHVISVCSTGHQQAQGVLLRLRQRLRRRRRTRRRRLRHRRPAPRDVTRATLAAYPEALAAGDAASSTPTARPNVAVRGPRLPGHGLRATTSTCRAPRWPRRTRPVWPR